VKRKKEEDERQERVTTQKMTLHDGRIGVEGGRNGVGGGEGREEFAKAQREEWEE
jgi:hypothetical protein